MSMERRVRGLERAARAEEAALDEAIERELSCYTPAEQAPFIRDFIAEERLIVKWRGNESQRTT